MTFTLYDLKGKGISYETYRPYQGGIDFVSVLKSPMEGSTCELLAGGSFHGKKPTFPWADSSDQMQVPNLA